MLHGENNPTLVRDTLFAIVMIILGGMVGVSLLAGGLRHREQHYNLQGANAYLSVIIPLALLTLSLPNFTVTTAGPTLSIAAAGLLASVAIGLSSRFLVIQTGRHRGYFMTKEEADEPHHAPSGHSLGWHAVLLVAYILPVVFLAEQLASPIDYLIETLRRRRRSAASSSPCWWRRRRRSARRARPWTTRCSARSTSFSARCYRPSG